MTGAEIAALLTRQKEYFASGATLPLKERRAHLARLYTAIKQREGEIVAALQADLGKSAFEGFMCEVGLVLSEITYMRRHLKRFAKARRVRTPLAQFCSRSYRTPVPRGSVLVMSPWNYPLLLTLEPLVDALAAGNTVILKPSAYAPATAEAVRALVAACFPPELVAVVTGGRAENQALLEQKFDLVFFTGSAAVGREVLRHTAEHLTPAVLELGGKSPCIVDASANLKIAARRIVFGKFLNCGQTCVAPDHVWCERSVKDALLREIAAEIKRQFGERPLENKDYGRIINEKHYARLCALIDPAKVVLGGSCDAATCRIAPTVMDGVTEQDAVMGEEIFGPILPVLTFEDFDALVDAQKGKEKPLALYLFTNNAAHRRRVLSTLSFGGGCINDVVVHLATSEMGFGGVGESGMGSYHGKAGFDAFSHERSILHKRWHPDLPMRYQPYRSRLYAWLLRKFLK